MRGSLRQRFEAKLQFAGPDECWLWSGASTGRTGRYKHGSIGVTGKKSAKAFRIAWQLYRGEIPEGLSVLHTCDNPLCVNPTHLFLGTHVDNMADMKAKKRSTFGERGTNSKLTEAIVREILTSTEPNAVLASRFSVAGATISNIRRRKLWRHIETPVVTYQRMGRIQTAETKAKISAAWRKRRGDADEDAA